MGHLGDHERFHTAMKEADASKGRRALSPVIVDPNRVQESGLVKDVVNMDIPSEPGNFDTTLVKLATSAERWAASAPHISRHSHPRAKPETPTVPPPPSDIDFAQLIKAAYATGMARGVNYAALTGASTQIPGRLDLLIRQQVEVRYGVDLDDRM